MFEVGKQYYSKANNTVLACKYVGEDVVVLQHTERSKREYVTTPGFFDQYEEYNPPKVITNTRYVYKSKDLDILYTSSDRYNGGEGVLGTIKLTYIEGQGLAVEVVS